MSDDILEFYYRDRFKMTQFELLEEPAEIYQRNLAIIQAENELNERERRHQERMVKMKHGK